MSLGLSCRVRWAFVLPNGDGDSDVFEVQMLCMFVGGGVGLGGREGVTGNIKAAASTICQSNLK
jgi:hypothetical protein